MKLQKLVEQKGYKVYCDMDGVLCDFDLQFKSLANQLPSEYRQN